MRSFKERLGVGDSLMTPAIRKLSAFGELESDDVALLQSLKQSERFSAGKTIRPTGEARPRPRVLVSGWAARQRFMPDGRRQILGIVLPGDLIGVCEYDANWAMTSTAALTSVETVDASSLFGPAGLMRGSPSLGRALAAAEAFEHWLAVEQIVRLGRRAALERAAHFLLEIEFRLGLAGLCDQGRFPLPITQEALSDVLGLSIVHINRTFLQLRRDRWIELRSRVVDLLKMDQLAGAADFQPPSMLLEQRVEPMRSNVAQLRPAALY